MAKIGKNVLENLTQAMYDDSRIVYREYIQNASDQIDIATSNNSYDEIMVFLRKECVIAHREIIFQEVHCP